jgi:hypothetical protein
LDFGIREVVCRCEHTEVGRTSRGAAEGCTDYG